MAIYCSSGRRHSHDLSQGPTRASKRSSSQSSLDRCRPSKLAGAAEVPLSRGLGYPSCGPARLCCRPSTADNRMALHMMIAVRRRAGAILLLLALAAVASGCAATSSGPATRCLAVPAGLRESLQASLKPGHHLTNLAAVRSGDQIHATPIDLADGVYMVSGQVRPFPGLVTWAVGSRGLEAGAGGIFGVGSGARVVSDAGREIRAGTLDSWGLSESTDGYQASRSCSEKATMTSTRRHQSASRRPRSNGTEPRLVAQRPGLATAGAGSPVSPR